MADLPQTFDRFEIVRVLGKGGMGTVYLARDLRLGRNVALKVLNPGELGHEERRLRFMREARSAAAIRHQNVATIYEVDETADGQPFIVMEYCEGETLSQRMRRRGLDSVEFLSIARQIAAGVAAAHENGIVHRDIKSSNIMLEPSGLVKILDFGLAKLLTREAMGSPVFETTSGTFFGTLHFISPEQARGQAADERSDLFSVGVVLYHMASGRLPFNGDSPLLVLDNIRDTEPELFVPLDPAFPATAMKIVSRLLQKNPEDRYQTAQDLLADLESIDTPTLRMSTHSTTMRKALGPTMRRRRRWIQVLVMLAAAVVVAATIYLVQRGINAPKTDNNAPVAIAPIKSMAVLPLRNVTNNKADDFLSVGLADALTTKLQAIPSLQVRPTSSVLEFQGDKADAKDASKKLQVDGVLEGHFLAAGDIVRVNLQLTDTRTGYNVWTDSVNGRRDDLLKLIDDVSARTLAGLNQKLGVPEAMSTTTQARSSNPRAYEQYLKARALNGSFVQEDFNAQVAALRKAIELDPNFAAAYADLAIALSLGQARSLVTDPDAMQKAEWSARQAVRLDPNLPQAHLALARVFVRMPNRFRESVRAALGALRLESTDSVALHSVASYFVSSGDMQKAQCMIDLMLRADPQSSEARARGYYNINAIDPEGALQAAQVALATPDTAIGGRDMRGLAMIMQGRIDEADREADEALKLQPRSYLGKSLKAMVAAARGNRAAAESHIASFEADAHRNHWAAIRIALCYAKLGDRDKAIEYVRLAATLGHHSWYALIKHPWFQPLQSDPEFQQITATIKADLDDVRDDVVGVYQLLCR
jgi:serine/threonine-protein kinase